MGLAQGTGRHFRQTNGLDFALTDQIAQGAHTVFDGDTFVPTVQVVQIDHVGLQSLECFFTGFANGFGATIDDPHQFAIALNIDTGHAAFAGQGEFLSVGFHDLAHQGFIGAKTIQGCSVKQGDTGVHGRQQNTFGLFCRNRGTIGMAQIHATQTNFADLKGT